MPVEIEIKLKVDGSAPIRETLMALGAQRLGEVLETNIFLDTSDRTLLSADCGLRIRRNRSLAGNEGKLVITYKGPREEGPVKRREEIEVVVDRIDPALALLDRLGFRETLCFEKRRESWRLDDCTVELDEMPMMGAFVEIEGPTEADVTAAQARLGLAALSPVPESYADLVTRHLSDIGEHGTRLTFRK